MYHAAKVGINASWECPQTAPKCRPPIKPRPKNWTPLRLVPDPEAAFRRPPTWHYSFVEGVR